MLLPLIAIIGRPNVGKSTLFNKILGARQAIVDDMPGVTRDRHYADSDYQGRRFRLVDTGGLDLTSEEGMGLLIRDQVQAAIAEADRVILVMDGRAGLTPGDEAITTLLRGITKPVFLTINKIDTPTNHPLLADFYRLGQDTLFPVSAEHGIGVDDLLEAVILPFDNAVDDQGSPSTTPRVTIVGRPNVGKSTLLNTLFGQDRMVVNEVPGTTRDAIDTSVTFQGRPYLFTDTAGIRRRGKIERGVEGYSVIRALRALGRTDVAILVLDGVEGITEQDTKIAGIIYRQGRGCILFVNKWDLQEKNPGATEAWTQALHRRLSFFPWVPLLFGSALQPTQAIQLYPLINRVMEAYTTRIATGPLNQFLQRIIQEHPLPIRKTKPTKAVKSVYATQVAIKPPVFALFVGQPQDVKPAYIRFLENRLRAQYEFSGTPIRIVVRRK